MTKLIIHYAKAVRCRTRYQYWKDDELGIMQRADVETEIAETNAEMA